MLTTLCWIMLLAPTPADVEKARDLYRIGGEAYRKARYEVAISAFVEARRLVDQPAVVFSLGQAARLQYFVDRKLEHLQQAVDAYRDYIEQVPSGRRVDHAAQHLSVLVPILQRAQIESTERRVAREAKVARLIVSSAVDGATASIDGGEPQPIPATFVVEPGERLVEVRAAEHTPATQRTTALAGAALPVNLAPTPLPGHLTVRAPAAETARLDGARINIDRLNEPIALPPGKHQISLTARGRVPFVRQFELDRKEALTIDADLPTTNRRIAAWSLLGLGVASVVTSGVFGGLALSAQSDAEDLESRRDRGGLSESDFDTYQRLEGTRDSRAELALGFGIAGSAALVTGILLWVFDHEQPKPVSF